MKRCVYMILLITISGLVQKIRSACPEYYYAFPEDHIIMNFKNPNINWEEEVKKENTSVVKNCVTDFECDDVNKRVVITACNGVEGGNNSFTAFDTKGLKPVLDDSNRTIEDREKLYSFSVTNFVRPSFSNETMQDNNYDNHTTLVLILPSADSLPKVKECTEYYYTFLEGEVDFKNPNIDWDNEYKKPHSNIKRKCVTDFKYNDNRITITAFNGITGGKNTKFNQTSLTVVNPKGLRPELKDSTETEDRKRSKYDFTVTNVIRPTDYKETPRREYTSDYGSEVKVVPPEPVSASNASSRSSTSRSSTSRPSSSNSSPASSSVTQTKSPKLKGSSVGMYVLISVASVAALALAAYFLGPKIKDCLHSGSYRVVSTNPS